MAKNKKDGTENVSADVKQKRKYTKKVKESVSESESNNSNIESTIEVESSLETNNMQETNVDLGNVVFEEVTEPKIESIVPEKKEKKENIVNEVANARAEILNSERQKALDIISELKDKIQGNLNIFANKDAETKKEEEKIELPKKEIQEEKETQLNFVKSQEDFFEQFVKGKYGTINHFELANSGIMINHFGMLEGRIGKYKLTRAYMGADWTYTIEQ